MSEMKSSASGDTTSEITHSTTETGTDCDNYHTANETRDDQDAVDFSSTEASLASQANLIVNYLPPEMTQDDVKTYFSEIGEVKSCKLIREKTTGESLGYAFVRYFSAKHADEAVAKYNGKQLLSKTIKVSKARPSCEAIKGANLYICGIPQDLSLAELEKLFGRYGRIITARILYDSITGASRGIAFIRFDYRQEAELAIEGLHGEIIKPGEEPITVKFANSPTGQYSNDPQKTTSSSSYFKKTPISRLFGNMMRPNFVDAMAAGTDSLEFNGYSIFVQNLAPEIDETVLWQLFGPFGAVQTVKIICDYATKRSRGFAFVSMTNFEEAILAICSLNGFLLNDKHLLVSFRNTTRLPMNTLASPLTASTPIWKSAHSGKRCPLLKTNARVSGADQTI